MQRPKTVRLVSLLNEDESLYCKFNLNYCIIELALSTVIYEEPLTILIFSFIYFFEGFYPFKEAVSPNEYAKNMGYYFKDLARNNDRRIIRCL